MAEEKTIRENFFEAKAAGALWDVAVSIKRGNPLPLDSNAVFQSYADLEAYAQGPVAYPGHVVAVVNENSTNIYYLDQNLAIQPVGAADGKSIDFNADGKLEVKGFKAADSFTLPQKQEDGSIKWVSISEIVEGDGNTVTSLEAADKSVNVEVVTNTEEKKEYNVKVNRSAVEGNQIELKEDGLYVAAYDDSALTEEVGKKANSADVYTKTEADALLLAKANAADVYTKEEANNLFGGAFHFKGEKASLDDLNAIITKNVGDVYQVGDKEYAWNGEEWVELGFNVDLSEYAKKGDSYTKAEADNLLAGKANVGDAYTKEEADNLLNGKADTSVTDGLNQRLETAEGEIDQLQLDIQDKANAEDVYDKEEVDELLSKKLEQTDLADYAKSADLESYAKTADVNAELDKKLNASELEGINNRINAKLDLETYNSEKGSFATDEELANAIGQAPTRTEGDDGEVSWDGATGIYTNIYTKDEITDLIADITGGESAADVLAALNAYKTSTDPRIKALENTVNGIPADEEAGTEKVAGLVERVENLEKKPEYELPIATKETLGGVISSEAENQVAVTAEGKMEVNSVNINKLTQTEGEVLILYGGSASDNI